MEYGRNHHINLTRFLVAILCIILLVGVVALPVIAAEITGHGVTGLTTTYSDTSKDTSSYGAKAWTAGSGTLNWSDTTSSKGWFSKTYYYKATTLTLTNNSGEAQVLTFDYSVTLNGGTVTIDGNLITSGGNFTKTLSNGSAVTITTKTSDTAANTTTVELSKLNLGVQNVTITFAAPTNGSYTVDGKEVTASTEKSNPSTTTYSLVAKPVDNYVFDGWYIDDALYSTEASLTAASFANSGTVSAKFIEDPLYSQANVPSDSTYQKNQLVIINSRYFHDNTEKLVKDGGFPGNNSAYSKLAQSGTKDKIDVQYVPSLQWSNTMSVAYSGAARGDYVTGLAEESYSYARMLSDVIRIYAKENCNISFDYANSMSGGGGAVGTETTNRIYIYITTAPNATLAQVKTGTTLTATSGSSGTIALSKGNYLYILAEGYERDRYLATAGTMNFSYSASISNFSVSYNQKKDILSAGFRDNTGKALTSGQMSVNNVGQAIDTNGNMADMAFVDLASVELKVNSAPANYVHIGWEITPKNGTTIYQYTPTYSRTMTEDVTVNAIFVPKMTITMGTNGYTDATYTLFDGTAASGQYVARNADCTAYYTSLADAFGSTDTVVLLAGDTITGDWTIPTDKTFVIPYGMNDKGSATPVMGGGMGSDYCLVNLNGNLTVAGTLIVNAQQNQNTGATGGNPGHLVVADGKTITVSGSLYAYGPVTGAGKIETTSTAKIHETLEFSDNTVVIYVYNIYNERSSKKVFPFNTMFINSVEVPVTYQQGATLTGHAAVRYDAVSTAEVPIIAGSGAMMNHTAGTITKYYDHEKGQFVFQYNKGSTVKTGPFSISMEVTVIGRTETITMNTADYYLPLSAPFRFDVAGNLIFNGKYKCLPGMAIDVKEGGKLTIADGSELVLYRGNDFDYRGKHANSTDQWGYTEKAYPQNPQRFNGVAYPFTFSISNMGSSNLNVDGELIVNGGLYVTNELQTEGDGLTLTSNGYNKLTGFGTIDMTNAATSLTSIYEVMRAASTNDLAWDTVDVVPLKGLKANATADEAAQYESLNGKTVVGSTNANGLNVWDADPCAAGHTEVTDAAVAATCTETGLTEGKHCSVCEEVLVAQTVVEALGHTEVIDEAVEATCTEAGLTEGKHCSVCEEVLVKQEVVDALGHKYESVYTKPTFEADGYTTYTCSACKHSYVATDEGTKLTGVAQIGETKFETLADAMDAAEDGDTITLIRNATGAGVVIDKSITIDFNGKTYTVNKAVGSAGTETLGFQILADNTVTLKNGTLTSAAVEDGGKEVKVLIQNYSDLTLTDMNLVDATEHIQYVLSNNSGKIAVTGATNITTDAVAFDVYDYSSAGYAVPSMTVNTTGTIKGAIEVSEAATLAISGGTFTVPIKEAWCAEGYGPSDLGDGLYGVHEHKEDAVSYHRVDGSETHNITVTCKCGEQIEQNTEDCADEDKNGVCDLCNSAVTYPAYTEMVILAEELQGDKTVSGNTVTLAVTGDVAYLRAQGTGAWGNWVGFKLMAPEGVNMTNVTILRPDNVTRNMDSIKDGENFAYLYWNMAKVESKQATYQVDWNGDGTYDLTVILDVANATLVGCEHAWGDGVVTKEPTAEAEGEMTYTCGTCGETKTESIDKVAHTHTLSKVEAKAATCIATGNIEHYKCTCGKLFSDEAGENEIDAESVVTQTVDHTWNDGEQIKAPTATEPGEMKYTCTVEDCGATKIEEIPAAGECEHTGGNATCKELAVCDLCKQPYGELAEHTPGEAVKENIQENGRYDAVVYCDVCETELSRNSQTLGTIVDRGKALVFEGLVFINQYLAFTEFEDKYLTEAYILENGGLEVTDETGYSYDVSLEHSGPYQGYDEYRAQTKGIATKQFTDTFELRPYLIIDGVRVYGTAIEYGVQIFAESQIRKTKNDYFKTALVAMLNYGTAAQERFNYNVENPANENLAALTEAGYLTAEQAAIGMKESYLTPVKEADKEMAAVFDSMERLGSISKTLLFEGILSMRYYVGVGGSNYSSTTEKTFYFWTAEDYAKLQKNGEILTKSNASYEMEAELAYTEGYGYEYVAVSQGIVAKEYSETVYACLCVTDADGKEYTSGIISYSPEQFAINKINNGKYDKDDNVAQWMVTYGELIKLYLENK